MGLFTIVQARGFDAAQILILSLDEYMSSVEKAMEGALLGSAVVMSVTPLLYAKNMAMTKRPFVLGH